MYFQKLHSETEAAFLVRAAAELEAVYTMYANQKCYVDYHRKHYGGAVRLGEAHLPFLSGTYWQWWSVVLGF